MKLNRHALPAIIVVGAVLVMTFWGVTAFAGNADPGSSADPLVTQSYVDQYVQWTIADMKTGQVFEGKAGTELLLRRGDAVVIDSTGNGIPDLTGGVDLKARERVPLNHLLLIPRDDGRGFIATGSVVVMYRGEAVIR